MIKAIFFISGENILGFSVTGHSGYDEQGKDIVCASVTSAALMAANTVTEIIRADAEAEADEGRIELKVSSGTGKVQAVLRGLELHLKLLAEEYPENIKVIYGGVK